MTRPPRPVIAVLPPAEAGPLEFLWPILLGMVGVALLIGVVFVVRKRFNAPDPVDVSSGFSLGGLRDLVRQGKMTQEEYDQAKAQIVAAAHRRTAEAAKAQAKPPANRTLLDD